MHIKAISNGQGGQSIYLGYLVKKGLLKVDLSITADTGDETDCLWNTGRRSTAKEYFEEITKPLFASWCIESVFVRARNKFNEEIAPISSKLLHTPANIPVYGSRGGQQNQSCTSRWKISAIHQEARRRGAKTLWTAQGIHYGEAARRVKGLYIGQQDGFATYKQQIKNKKTKELKTVKWLSHSYPLVDLRLNRYQIREELESLGIPYLISSECDFCPHQDYARWSRRTTETIDRAAEMEASWQDEFFLTDIRKPLKQAIAIMKAEEEAKGYLFGREQDIDFGCGNSYCGV